jgi:probable O-glycosylation ligase (exosortase A-associated)
MKPLLTTFGITAIGAVGGLVNPYVGFLAYVALALLKPDSLWEWSVPQGNYSRIVAICMLVGWIGRGCGNWRFGKAGLPVAALMGFWIWSAVCAAQAPIPEVAWKFVNTISKIALPFLVGITLIDSVQKLRQLAWVIVLTQGYVAFEMNLSYFEGFNRVKMTGFGGMEEGSISIYMVTGAGVAIQLALHSAKRWQQLALFVITLMLVHVPMMSDSRGGMVGLIVMSAVSFLVIPKTPRYYAGLAVALVLGLQLAGPSVRDRFITSFASDEERDASAESRLYLWGCCWDMMKDEPLFGVGPDHFPYTVGRYGKYDSIEAHTLWLQIGAELGFPGMIFLAGFYLSTVVRLVPICLESKPVPDSAMRAIGRIVISSLVGFAISAQFISLEGLEAPYYVALLGIGALKILSFPVEIAQGSAEDSGQCNILTEAEHEALD